LPVLIIFIIFIIFIKNIELNSNDLAAIVDSMHKKPNFVIICYLYVTKIFN